ncbi:MAG TPA: CBS domain-containing protein [Gemmatimonadales bacterium]|nr:CBS domain-containing protein [Gemmatimonadales bacterium]
MRLADLLDRRRVVVPLESRSVREATTQLARALASAGAVADEARLGEILQSEWPEDVVMVGGRAFLPHFRTDAAAELALAIGVAPQPICRSNDPNRCARVVVLIVAPTRDASEYLRAMSAVARALASDEVLAGLHAARSPDDVLALAGLRETPVPADVTVRDLMTMSVTTVGPDTTLNEAARVMLGRGVRALPVTGDNGEVLGLLTDGHLLKHLLPQTVQQLSTGQMKAVKRRTTRASPTSPRDLPVREAMDRTVLCLAEDQTIADVAALMLAKDVDRFPVTRDGALVGFLTRGDIVRKLLGY